MAFSNKNIFVLFFIFSFIGKKIKQVELTLDVFITFLSKWYSVRVYNRRESGTLLMLLVFGFMIALRTKMYHYFFFLSR